MSLLDQLNNKKIILASTSPRRKELLEHIGIRFTLPLKEDITYIGAEEYPKNTNIKEVAELLALQKLQRFSKTIDNNTIVICADTTVVVGDKILGKPKDYSEGVQMLKELSGKTHSVITGVAIKDISKTLSFSDESLVEFYPLSDSDIAYYLNNYKPFDKAGAYGIQEWIGVIGVKKIVGSFYNIMGLPTEKLYQKLSSFI